MKKLSGKDVMPGDFVQREGFGIGTVVECSLTHILVNFDGKVEHLAWCEGVLLRNHDNLIESFRDRYNIPLANYQYTKRGYREEIWYSFIINSRDHTLDVIGVFDYIHELQHALSTVGYVATI